jgi:hypothetical protein
MSEIKQNSSNKCSTRLKQIREINVEKITLGNLVHTLEEAGFSLIMIIFSLPLLLPTPGLPGVSQSCGAVLLILSLQLIVNRTHIWLPEKLNNRQLNKATLDKVIDKSLPFIMKVERSLRPRITWLTGHNGGRKLLGVVAFIGTIPIILPFPFSNTLPAFSICFMALGRLEHDGLFTIIGLFIMILAWVVIALIAIFGIAVFQNFMNYIF